MSDENVPKKCIRSGCTYAKHCRLYQRDRAALTIYPQREGKDCPFYRHYDAQEDETND